MGFENSFNCRFYLTIGKHLVINGVVYFLCIAGLTKMRERNVGKCLLFLLCLNVVSSVVVSKSPVLLLWISFLA